MYNSYALFFYQYSIPSDVDECSALAELCQHGKCINIPGAFHCVCDKGFQLNRYRNNCTGRVLSGVCLIKPDSSLFLLM